MEASSPEPRPVTPPLPKRDRSALGHDPTKPLMTGADLLDWPRFSIVDPDDKRDSLVIARELRLNAERGDDLPER